MDYEKKYKGALERAKNLHKDAIDMGENLRAKQYEIIFSELKELEDEKTRKEIILALKYANHKGIYNKHLAWLEKQSEQKPNDKVEPKFHSGDWVVDTVYDKAMQVLFLEDDGYEFENGIWIPYADAKERVHLWTIKDAKDGDVLISKYGKPFIYNGNFDSVHIGSYCGISTVDSFNVATEICQWTENVDIHPATKEQRELLFQKMKESGYEWDAEQKKLKKIHVIDEGKAEMDYCFTKMMNGEKVSSDWGEDDEIEFNHILKTLTSVAKEQEIKGYNNLTSSINWLTSLKDRIQPQPQPKQDWSEEDEIGLGDALWAIKQAKTIAKDENDMGNIWYAETWLNTIKDRVQPQWKPSEEQLNALDEVYKTHSANNVCRRVIFNLLEQLKKL